MSNKKINTKYGTAQEYNGYYTIVSRKEGNHGKKLHRLIYEDYHKVTILDGYHVHHKNGNKEHNYISNLELIDPFSHNKVHHSNKSIGMYGKKHSEETKQKMSNSQKGKSKSKEHSINSSKSRNTSGYYRVNKLKNPKVKQGFVYRYQYSENGKSKSIYSTDINKLKEKVLAKGLEWIEY